MPSQAMNRRKKDATSYKSKYEDYENGKPRDKKQKKLNEFIWENEKDD